MRKCTHLGRGAGLNRDMGMHPPDYKPRRAERTVVSNGASADQFFRLSGTFAPLLANSIMTALCSQMFISAEPSLAPA